MDHLAELVSMLDRTQSAETLFHLMTLKGLSRGCGPDYVEFVTVCNLSADWSHGLWTTGDRRTSRHHQAVCGLCSRDVCLVTSIDYPVVIVTISSATSIYHGDLRQQMPLLSVRDVTVEMPAMPPLLVDSTR
jgi:hypothetical protein